MRKFKFTIIAVLVIIALFIPKLFHKITNKASDKATEVTQDVGKKVTNEIIDSATYMQFNNTTVLGPQIQLAEQLVYKDGVIISVKTLSDNDYKHYSKENPYNVKDKDNSSYIKLTSKFKSVLVKDSKGNVTEIKFDETK